MHPIDEPTPIDPRRIDESAAKVLAALADAGDAGLTQTRLSRGVFGGHKRAARLRGLLARLIQAGLIRKSVEAPPPAGGRPITTWSLTALGRRAAILAEPAANWSEPAAAARTPPRGFTDVRVREFGPLDEFTRHTMTVPQWIERSRAEGFPDVQEFIASFLEACDAVSHHPYWDGCLRHDPRVAMNLTEDGEAVYFIFKLSNNGTTFLVGDFPDVGDGFIIGGDTEVFRVRRRNLEAANLFPNEEVE